MEGEFAVRHLPIDDFGAAYGLKRTKIYELINSGALQAVKIGSRTKIPVEAAERWSASLPEYKAVTRRTEVNKGSLLAPRAPADRE